MRAAQSIVKVGGISVGQATDLAGLTGCTVVLCPEGATAVADVRGGAPGTRETDLLGPGRLVQQIHAIVLSGGSVFGLAAADGVLRYLAERGHGFAIGARRVPIVPAAILFDLSLGSSHAYPDGEAGYRAAASASMNSVEEGSVGAGTGATVGKVRGPEFATKGGIGTAALRLADGNTVGAIVAVNALGDVVSPLTGQIIAGSRDPRTGAYVSAVNQILGADTTGTGSAVGGATTIGVVATDAILTRDELTRVAALAHDGLARVIRPAHTIYDGDTFFALATGRTGTLGNPLAISVAAGEVVATAIIRAVMTAQSLGNLPSASEFAAARAGSSRRDTNPEADTTLGL